MAGYCWRICNSGDANLPANSVPVDNITGSFIGRGFFGSQLLPGIITPDEDGSLTSLTRIGNRREPTTRFEILTGTGCEWVNTVDGNIPENAIAAGYLARGDPVYFGRKFLGNYYATGIVNGQKNSLIANVNNIECVFAEFEILCGKADTIFCQCCHASIFPQTSDAFCVATSGQQCVHNEANQWKRFNTDANFPQTESFVVASVTRSNVDEFIGRIKCRNKFRPIQINSKMRRKIHIYCAGTYLNSIAQSSDLEALVGANYGWVAASQGHTPFGAVSAGNDESGNPLFVGRTFSSGMAIIGTVDGSAGGLFTADQYRRILCHWSYEVLVNLDQVNVHNRPRVQHTRESERQMLKCKVCMDRELEVALIPCGHAVLCERCLDAGNIRTGKCPICRVKVHNTLRIFM